MPLQVPHAPLLTQIIDTPISPEGSPPRPAQLEMDEDPLSTQDQSRIKGVENFPREPDPDRDTGGGGDETPVHDTITLHCNNLSMSFSKANLMALVSEATPSLMERLEI